MTAVRVPDSYNHVSTVPYFLVTLLVRTQEGLLRGRLPGLLHMCYTLLVLLIVPRVGLLCVSLSVVSLR